MRTLHTLFYFMLFFGPLAFYLGLVIGFSVTITEVGFIGTTIGGVVVAYFFKKFIPLTCPSCNAKTLYLYHNAPGGNRFSTTQLGYVCRSCHKHV